MLITKKSRLAVFICLFFLCFFFAGTLIRTERLLYTDISVIRKDLPTGCMDVPVIEENLFLEEFTEDPSLDIPKLSFNGQKISVTADSLTLYISQPTDSLGHFTQLYGTLISEDPNYSLYFINNSALQNLETSVHTNTPLQLIAANDSSYRKIHVVITTLPVLYLEQSYPDTYVNDNGREVFTGSFALFGKVPSSPQDYCVDSGITEWHLRGGSSSFYPKTPLKLSLKDSFGGNSNHDFFGLGADDDYILNPMVMDDTDIREKFAMDLWNSFISDGSSSHKMSSGEYVEVIVNQEYRGLYLLQRRVDRKYLELDPDQDILLKGKNL